jgi:hypothetical protein
MENFDGFIAAIATEFKINIHKDKEKVYLAKIPFEGGRSQEVLITLNHDESGDETINYYSVIASLKKDSGELYKMALTLNATLHYGALALSNNALIIRNSVMLKDIHPHRFIKSLTYVAAKADELEELLVKKDLH